MNDRVLDAAMRQDLVAFIRKSFGELEPARTFYPNWHIEAIAWHLQQVSDGKIKRLLITLPPRYLKSICASVAFPAWVLGHDPTKRVICVSYSNELTIKLSLDCRRLMDASWYQRAFPRTRISRYKDTQNEFATTRNGSRYATSVGGALTGRGGSILIIDDPIKPEDAMSEVRRKRVNDWFSSTAYSRLDNKKNDAIIVIMQRLHVDDLVGNVLEVEDWTHLDLPAIAEVDQAIPIGPDRYYHRRAGELLHADREPQDVLDRLKAGLGSTNFSAQYQQRPLPPDGEMISLGWFQRYDELPARKPSDRIIQSWDTASKAEQLNDYSVCTTWYVQGNEFYLVDVFRRKLVYPDLKDQIVKQALMFGAKLIVIEDKGAGTGLIQELKRANIVGVPKPRAYNPTTDKVTRMSIQSSKIESGHVFLPRKAFWLGAFETEVRLFPNGSHDDQIDSMSQFLNWWDERNRHVVRSGPF